MTARMSQRRVSVPLAPLSLLAATALLLVGDFISAGLFAAATIVAGLFHLRLIFGVGRRFAESVQQRVPADDHWPGGPLAWPSTHPPTHVRVTDRPGIVALPPRPGRRYDQCDDTCTVDCGHCKGAGKPPVSGWGR